MNNFDIVFNNLKSNNIDCDIKKKDQYGNLISIQQNEIESLGTKSIIASTAGLLKNLSKDEKMIWAMEMKQEGNNLFHKQLYQEAMMKYMETLAATDLGDVKNNQHNIIEKNNDLNNTIQQESIEEQQVKVDVSIDMNHGNIDELVIPVLCNLAACCIHLKEWKKVISFCEQVILLRSNCSRAYLRKGIGYLNTNESELALHCFLIAQKYANEWNHYVINNKSDNLIITKDTDKADIISIDSSTKCSKIQALCNIDMERLPNLIIKAKQGIKNQKEILLKQKESLKNAFNKYNIPSSSSSSNNDNNNNSIDNSNNNKTINENGSIKNINTDYTTNTNTNKSNNKPTDTSNPYTTKIPNDINNNNNNNNNNVNNNVNNVNFNINVIKNNINDNKAPATNNNDNNNHKAPVNLIFSHANNLNPNENRKAVRINFHMPAPIQPQPQQPPILPQILEPQPNILPVHNSNNRVLNTINTTEHIVHNNNNDNDTTKTDNINNTINILKEAEEVVATMDYLELIRYGFRYICELFTQLLTPSNFAVSIILSERKN